MTPPRQSLELDTEREIDLARWRRSLVQLWWLPVLGLVVGAVIGVALSLGGTSNYQATALISLGQPASPGGTLLNGFGQNPRAVSLITSSAWAQDQAATRADMRPGALRGHVSVAQVGTSTGTGAARATPVISLTVTGAHGKNVTAAANVLAQIVVKQTTEPYVAVKIATFQSTYDSVTRQLGVIQDELATVQAALKASRNLDPLQRLVIVSQEDNAETRQGNLIAQQNTLQQQLAFARKIESASVITPAAAVKASAHSRSSSLVVGAIIGLLIGAVAAIALGGRRRTIA